MTCLGNIGELCEPKQVEWKIPDILSLQATKGSFYTSPSFTFANVTWCLHIYPTGNDKAKSEFLSVYLIKETGSPCTALCTLHIKKNDGTFVKGGTGYISFTPSTLAGYTNFCGRSDLLLSESELVPSGILTIICQIRINQDGNKEVIRSEKEENIDVLKQEFKRLDVLSNDLRHFFANKDTCDTVLQVKDKEFKAHKAILMARSPVFAAMFQHDTLEKQKGFINIPDCDPDSFQEFLEYLYSGKILDMPFSNVFHLYSTSNKYDVQEIKEFCVEYLMKSLAADNLSDVITFADKHDEKRLLSESQDFFNENFGEVFLTTEWEGLMKNDYRLANKILIEMSKSKGSK